MSKVHLDSFLAHARSLRRGKFTESRSSLLGLITFLRANVGSPKPLSFDAVKRELSNPHDPRLGKYQPAIAALVNVWASAQPYSNAAVQIMPAPLMGGSLQDKVAIPHSDNARRFAVAYKKARLFSGLRYANVDDVMV